MITPRVEVVNEKTIRLSGLNRLLASCLQGLDEVLSRRDSPAAGRRLMPPPSADEVIKAVLFIIPHPTAISLSQLLKRFCGI